VIGGWRKLHNLYFSLSIITMTKARRTWLVAHIARMVNNGISYRLLVEKPEKKRPLKDQDVGA
jgi:hypothetical protein